jgi:uncharacterized RDD family membrane protein YckC
MSLKQPIFKRYPDGNLSKKASLALRFYATLADTFIYILLVVILYNLLNYFGNFFGVASSLSGSQLIHSGIIGWGFLLYYIGFESRYGQTLGKRIVGIVVTKRDGSHIGLKESIIRNLARFIDVLPTLYILGASVMGATDNNQRIGDLAAKTYVVKVVKEGK